MKKLKDIKDINKYISKYQEKYLYGQKKEDQ